MMSSFRFIRLLLLIFVGFFFVITYTSIEVEALAAIHIFDNRLKLQPSPLIGGPAWLPLHCKVIVDDTHIYDFVPLNATSTETIQKLIQLQAVPAKVQQIIRRRSSEPQTISNDSSNNNSYKNDNNNNNVNDEELAKLFIERAEQFCQEYDQDLHLIKSNCWSFAFDLILYVLALPVYPEEEKKQRARFENIDNN
jgi:hypothetical protein